MDLRDISHCITTNEYSSLHSNKYVYMPIVEESDGLC